jgi:O-antigen/teichoic acid export membrane protein
MIKNLSSNILVYGITNGIKSLVPFILLPLLTTYLTVDEFGTLSLLEVSILVLFPFISLNIFSVINIEFFHLEKKQLAFYITNTLSLSFISFIFFFILFFFFSSFINKYTALPLDIIWALPVFALLRLLPQVLLGLLQVSKKVNLFSVVTLVQACVDFGLSYAFVVLYKWGYMGRLEGVYISAILVTLYAFMYLYKYGYLERINFKYTKRILSVSLPLIPHVLGGVIIAMSDRYFIMYYHGNEMVAYYTVAYQIAAIMLLFGTSINQAWIPFLYTWLKEKKLSESIKYTIILIVLFLGIGGLVYIMKDTLFYIFVDKNFYLAKIYFPWLLIGFIFQSLYFLMSNFIFFKKRTNMIAMITISGAILNLGLNYYWMQQYGVVGVAYATAVTWMLFFGIVAIVAVQYKNEV